MPSRERTLRKQPEADCADLQELLQRAIRSQTQDSGQLLDSSRSGIIIKDVLFAFTLKCMRLPWDLELQSIVYPRSQ